MCAQFFDSTSHQVMILPPFAILPFVAVDKEVVVSKDPLRMKKSFGSFVRFLFDATVEDGKGGMDPVFFIGTLLLAIVVVFFIFSEWKKFSPILDKYSSVEEVSEALRVSGLEVTQLIVGIDFTGSNQVTGARSFGGRCLHDLVKGTMNPYQHCIDVIGRTLAPFDADGDVPVFVFGDSTTRSHSVREISSRSGHGFNRALAAYEKEAKRVEEGAVTLSGPTSFAPLIREAIGLVRETNEHHTLVILTDGAVNQERETIAAIVEASNYPLSIIIVGVGDGPWELMREFDDGLPKRGFDNVQLVIYEDCKRARNFDSSFALAALMELPQQYKYCRKHLL